MEPLLTILTTIALCSSSWATDARFIEATDAAKYVGETLVVHGTIVEVQRKRYSAHLLTDR